MLNFCLDKSKYTVTKYTLNGCVYEKFERIPGTESDDEEGEKEDETEEKIDEIPPPLVKAETSTIETIEESSTINPMLGMISHQKSQITVFGHKHYIKNFLKKFYIFHKKFQLPSILVHILNQIAF